jgi:hypothetical protein
VRAPFLRFLPDNDLLQEAGTTADDHNPLTPQLLAWMMKIVAIVQLADLSQVSQVRTESKHLQIIFRVHSICLS